MSLKTNTHSQRGRWERGRSPVGGDCYHTILNPIFKIKYLFDFMSNIGAIAIASYGFSNIKIILYKQFDKLQCQNGITKVNLFNKKMFIYFIGEYYDL